MLTFHFGRHSLDGELLLGTAEPRKFEGLEIRGLFRIISSSNYTKVDMKITPVIIIIIFSIIHKFWAHERNVSRRLFYSNPSIMLLYKDHKLALCSEFSASQIDFVVSSISKNQSLKFEVLLQTATYEIILTLRMLICNKIK